MQFMQSSREEAEKVFIVVENNQGAALSPGVVVEWSQTATDADQGVKVELVDAVVNVTTGIAGRVAGVVDSTISTADTGRLQVYGPANVRASASIAAGAFVVASSINATNIGHVTTGSASTLTGPAYAGAVVGWTLEDGPNATNATVQLALM
tara:strand:- start:6245 stop:6700 length:456 start_codon:yes stop_codon:yes gene_type:complete